MLKNLKLQSINWWGHSELINLNWKLLLIQIPVKSCNCFKSFSIILFEIQNLWQIYEMWEFIIKYILKEVNIKKIKSKINF